MLSNRFKLNAFTTKGNIRLTIALNVKKKLQNCPTHKAENSFCITFSLLFQYEFCEQLFRVVIVAHFNASDSLALMLFLTDLHC